MPAPFSTPLASGTQTGSFAMLDDSGGTVSEIVIITANSIPLAARFHPLIVARFIRIPDAQVSAVKVGWVYNRGTKTFAEPAPPAPPGAPLPYFVPVPMVRERLEADGFWEAAAEALTAPGNAAIMLKVVTLSFGLSPTDPAALALLASIGADSSRILAHPSVILPPL